MRRYEGKKMGKKKSKKLSNPFSTGGGGGHFEAQVQASFVALMLTAGSAPCIPNLPISKIKLQGKFAGYDTDDLIIFVEKPSSNQKQKILGQIKHTINITEKDSIFKDVIQAAWNDFNNDSLFSKGIDVIALITGPLSLSDINDTRTILDWSRQSETAEEFFKKVELTYFSSRGKQNKLQAFRTNLRKANNGNAVSDEALFEFLKHFHVLGYDLDLISGVTLSLLHSLLGQYSQENASFLWARIVDEVQSTNKNAGTISLESLPPDLKVIFAQKPYAVIPDEFSKPQISSAKPDWNQLSYSSDLAIANLLGSWNEQAKSDLDIISQLTSKDSASWLANMREILHQPASPLILRNGKWHVTARIELWQQLGARLFDDNLDRFKKSAVKILTERDPQFDLPIEERFAASVYGKVSAYSPEIRKGMAESLALLGNKPNYLTHSSQHKPRMTAVVAVREILNNAD